MSKPDERVPSGILGLDKLIQGGFVKGSSILISGKAGSGKTIFCLQYLLESLKKGDPAVYMTLEETADEIRKDALSFDWDLSQYEKNGMLKIVEKNLFDSPEIELSDLDKIKAKVLVIDSISIMSLMISDKASLRNRLNTMIKSIKDRDITLLLISEAIEGSEFSRLGVEEYLADAVIQLAFTPIGPQSGRNLFIRKMRRTKHSENMHPIEIGKNGIRVLSI